MDIRRVILIAVALFLVSAIPAYCSVPKPGFVMVLGSAVPGVSHSDRGAPAPLQGLALKYSGGEIGYCNINADLAIDPLVASGKEVVAYVTRGLSSQTGQWLYSKGVRRFIFENEPDGNLSDYLNAMPTGQSAIHAAGAGTQSIMGNCFTSDAYNFLYNHGGTYTYTFKDYSDIFGFHCYSDEADSGISIGSIVNAHNIMSAYGDGAKPMFIGEGWGPKREIRTCPRLSPDIPPTTQEVQLMRDFIVNGWNNLTTAKDGYDPNWVKDVLFFTLSDNWGFDYAHFYDGGLIDMKGNPKDDLLLLFPGNKLTVANCGFEYYNLGKPSGAAPSWDIALGTPESCYSIDASISHSGQRSQRLESNGSNHVYVTQASALGSVTAGRQYTAAGWVKTLDVPSASAGAKLGITFLDSSEAAIGSTSWSSGVNGTSDWQQITVTATAPANAVKLKIYCDFTGTDGRAWFDDCSASEAATLQTGNLEGYALDQNNNGIASVQITVLPSGLKTTTSSTGKFSMSGLAAGTCDVTTSRVGYNTDTIKKVVIAPGRTSIVGLNLPAANAAYPWDVKVDIPSISSTLKISWKKPVTGADFYRIYRSTASGVLGTMIFDNVTSLYVWDEGLDGGLSDYKTYYYTVRRVYNGVESTNTDTHSGVPVSGATVVSYDNNADPGWNNSATVHGQTFVAVKTGGIISATCVLATGGTPNTRQVTFSVMENATGGKQIGPSKTVTGYSDEQAVANWSGSEVPVVAGNTYYLKITLSSTSSIYRSKNNVYPNGQYYRSGIPYGGSVDLWSTITIAEGTVPDILNIKTANAGAGKVTVSWETSAPTGGQVEYGTSTSYGSTASSSSTSASEHNVTLTNLVPGDYHFRIKSTKPRYADAYSSDYKFTVQKNAASISEVKSKADVEFLGFSGVVTGIYKDHLYVEDTDRKSGIRVSSIGVGITEGMPVYVIGTLKTDSKNERYIENPIIIGQ